MIPIRHDNPTGHQRLPFEFLKDPHLIMRQVSVLLFARARDLAQTPAVDIEISAAATLKDVQQAVFRRIPALQPLTASLIWAVNGKPGSGQQTLSEGDEVACYPPVSGG
ncbi:MAG: MoaD/ThiS family protein [Planctomycetaceae bacterium]|nr:MoaD/ThiS family protein [Planctomycetaceae bacterium]